MLKSRSLTVGIIMSIVLLVAVACGDDATATPVPTQPPPAAIDAEALRKAVETAVMESIPEQPTGPLSGKINKT